MYIIYTLFCTGWVYQPRPARKSTLRRPFSSISAAQFSIVTHQRGTGNPGPSYLSLSKEVVHKLEAAANTETGPGELSTNKKHFNYDIPVLKLQCTVVYQFSLKKIHYILFNRIFYGSDWSPNFSDQSIVSSTLDLRILTNASIGPDGNYYPISLTHPGNLSNNLLITQIFKS